MNYRLLTGAVEALRSLQRQGRQTVLALLGILMGSSSIVAMISIGNNATDHAMAIYKGMGTDTQVAHFLTAEHQRREFPLASLQQRLQTAAPGPVVFAPVATAYGTVIYRGNSNAAVWVGITPSVKDAMALQLEEGRFISDFDHRAMFVVVGHALAEKLSSPGAPLRTRDFLSINGYRYQVIGVLKYQVDNFLIPVKANDSLFLPLASMGRVVTAVEVDSVIVKNTSTASTAVEGVDIEDALRTVFPGRPFTIRIAEQVIAGMNSQARTFRYLLVALGSISLMGAGVGVMNVLLMSVSQRRREIGVRLALGARRADIRNVFLSEALVLSLVGAMLGVLIGAGAAFAYARAAGWEYHFAPGALLLGGGGTILVGLFFGLYPAIIASRLQPVAALRDE